MSPLFSRLYTWAELIRIIDDECPDGERLDVLKAAFYNVNKINQTDADQIVSYQLWQIARSWRSGDGLLLRSIYAEINRAPTIEYPGWQMHMAKVSGLVIEELVERHASRLRDTLLMESHKGKPNAATNRLTQLGLRFFKNIETYEIDLDAARKAK